MLKDRLKNILDAYDKLIDLKKLCNEDLIDCFFCIASTSNGCNIKEFDSKIKELKKELKKELEGWDGSK